MNLYIITKDDKPYNGSTLKKDTFVKAYYDEDVAKKTAKAFCSAEANSYYRYGQGYYDNEDKDQLIINKLAKELAEKEMDRWRVVTVEL